VTWTLETSQGFESDKIAHLVVPYLQGRCLDIGAGMRPVWPSLIAVDNGHHFGAHTVGIRGDGTRLDLFTDASMNGVFSSHFLEHVERDKVPAVLTEWRRVLKVGGHLVLYVPSANLYPKMGEPGANPDHKWDIAPGDIEAVLKTIGGWELLRSEERGESNEYSLLIVARKTEGGWTENLWQRNPDGKKRCLIHRYGALGDSAVLAAILPALKRDGYHVTVNGKPSTYEVLKHDPHIDEWIVQAEDFVPNEQLGPYWEQMSVDYDKVVNLCESVENALLAVQGRINHNYAHGARRRLYDRVNYLERTADIADVPHKFDGRFYMTAEERGWAETQIEGMAGPVVAWAINGSSPHKVWPFTQVVVKWILDRTPGHVVLLTDGGIGKQLQDAIIGAIEADGGDISRIHGIGGKWGIRQSIAFAHYADVVVGPETGILNWTAFATVPKVCYLSHSTADNLTKHWRNTVTLAPPEGKVPCYPCHMLHNDWTFCHQSKETGAALCASAISPERVFGAIVDAAGLTRAA
jgi:ADP-heptose:LPS heptosyltransferase/predicted SAM-dependent methyltransferase